MTKSCVIIPNPIKRRPREMVSRVHIVLFSLLLCVKIQFHRVVSFREMSDTLILPQNRVRRDGASRRHTWLGFTDGAFSLSLHFSGREFGFVRGERNAWWPPRRRRENETKSRRSTWKRKRGLVVTAGTDFIGLSSLYIFLLQGVAAPAFSRSRTRTQPSLLTLDVLSFSLSLCSLPTDPCIHRQPPHFVHCAFISSPTSAESSSLSRTPISHLETSLDHSLHRLFICDSPYFLHR